MAQKVPRAQRSLLAAAFNRQIKPNWRRYVQYAEMAANVGDLAMRRFVETYKSMKQVDQLNWWPEQICEYANVTPGELMGAVCRAMWENNAAECSMILSMANPEILKSTIRFAKKEEGVKDREMFYRLMGQLPDKKGTSINIYNRAAGDAPAPQATVKGNLKTFDAEIIDMDRDLESDGKTLAEVFGVSRQSSPEDD